MSSQSIQSHPSQQKQQKGAGDSIIGNSEVRITAYQKGPYPAEKWLGENTRPVCAEKLWKKWGELLETRQKGVLSYSGKKLSELSCWCAKWVWTWSTWIPYWDSWFQSKGVVRFPLLLLFPCKWEDTIWGKDYCAERNKNLMVQKAVYLPRQ